MTESQHDLIAALSTAELALRDTLAVLNNNKDLLTAFDSTDVYPFEDSLDEVVEKVRVFTEALEIKFTGG